MRVLFVRFSSLGDVVLTTPLIRAVRARYAAAHLTVATNARYAPVVERAPGVDRVVALEPAEPLGAFARRLGRGYDAQVDLHASLRSFALRQWLGGAWGVYRSHPVRRRWMAARHRVAPSLTPVVIRYADAARRAGLDVTLDPQPVSVVPTADDRRAADAVTRGACIVLCPGAAHASKRWPADHWRDLAALLAARTTVVATGTRAERMPLPGAIDAFGLPLGPTAALLAGATAVVANDSGLMHLAAAVGTPVVGLFGPTHPAFGYAPWQAPQRVLERVLPCRPCATHGGPRCPRGHHACLAGIAAAEVTTALGGLVA